MKEIAWQPRELSENFFFPSISIQQNEPWLSSRLVHLTMDHNPGPQCGLYFSSIVVVNEVAFLRRLNPPLAQGTGTCAFKLLVRRLALDVDVGKWQISVVYLRFFLPETCLARAQQQNWKSRPLVDITTRPKILDAFLENYNRKLASGNVAMVLIDAKALSFRLYQLGLKGV